VYNNPYTNPLGIYMTDYTTKEANEIAMFGSTISNIESSAKNSTMYRIQGDYTTLIMSVLSDAQEELARHNDNKARQMMNVAKYLCSMQQQERRD
jgi:hypothetical protein